MYLLCGTDWVLKYNLKLRLYSRFVLIMKFLFTIKYDDSDDGNWPADLELFAV